MNYKSTYALGERSFIPNKTPGAHDKISFTH